MPEEINLANSLLKNFLKNYKGVKYIDSKINLYDWNTISTDSRKIKKGDIFISLNGENFKGDNFIIDAFKLGAKFCITSKESKGKNQIIVDSTLGFIHDFASFIIEAATKLKKFAITGTNGKTTTKELLKNILLQKFNVLASEGNFNNQIGVPITIFNLNKSHEILISEMGTNSHGEIEKLSKIAKPDFATITNIGTGHTEGLKNKKNIFYEKSNITKYFNKNSLFSFNLDDEFIKSFYKKIDCGKITYGINNEADLKAVNISNDFTNFDIKYKESFYSVKLKAPGLNNIYNSLCSASLAMQTDMNIQEIVNGINSFDGISNRFKIINLKNDNVIINDTYNANPDSTIRAIEMTNKIFYKKKKIAILGSMLELGEESSKEHQSVSSYLKKNEFKEVYSYGPNSNDYKKNLDKNTNFIELKNHNEIEKYINLNSTHNTVILVKGSRGMKMEKILISLGL